MLLSNLGTFMFQEGMNNMFCKGLIHYYGKSYIFLTKINRFSYSTWLSAKFLADDIYSEEDIKIIQMSSDDNLSIKKKLKIGD